MSAGLLVFSYRAFMVSSITCKSVVHFELILVYGVRRRCSPSFCTYLSRFPRTIYRLVYLYPIVCSCLLCQRVIDHKGMGLFLGTLFCLIDLYALFCARTMLFWWVWPCAVWYLERDISSLVPNKTMFLKGFLLEKCRALFIKHNLTVHFVTLLCSGNYGDMFNLLSLFWTI